VPGIELLKDHVQTEGSNIFRKFLKIERHFRFPHDFGCTTTNRKVCLGPGTEIEVSGKLFCRKVSVRRWGMADITAHDCCSHVRTDR